MTGTPTNGWSRAEMHVLDSLDRLEKGQGTLQESVSCIDRKLAGLAVEMKVKSAVVGSVAGLIAGILIALFSRFAG